MQALQAALLVAPLHLTTATPIAVPQAMVSPSASDTFHLRVQVLSPQTIAPPAYNSCTSPSKSSIYNNTYLAGYHTGAGLNDVVLTPNRTIAPPAFLNGTSIQFYLGGALQDGSPIPWALQRGYGQTYSSFSPMEINVGYGTQGHYYAGGYFYLNDTTTTPCGLWFNTAGTVDDPTLNATTISNGFGGWLACEWWHYALPQLFWIAKSYSGRPFVVPVGCELVNIYREDI